MMITVSNPKDVLAKLDELRAAIRGLGPVQIPWDAEKWGPHTPEREAQVRRHLAYGDPLPPTED